MLRPTSLAHATMLGERVVDPDLVEMDRGGIGGI
jgi:hypothetical protein